MIPTDSPQAAFGESQGDTLTRGRDQCGECCELSSLHIFVDMWYLRLYFCDCTLFFWLFQTPARQELF
jgi:hypothetical protein